MPAVAWAEGEVADTMERVLIPPCFPDAATRDRVREWLNRVGFREAQLCAAVGVHRWSDLGRLGTAERIRRVRELERPEGLALELLWLGRVVEIADAGTAFGGPALRALEASGLVARENDHLRPLVALSPVGDLVFAYDLKERHRSRAVDYVLGPGAVTRLMVDLMLEEPVEATLDLGCGAGILGAVATGHARRVVATDVNSRAVAFSRFNLALNGLEHVECREGSLFEPVRRERFDQIICDPPFVLSPAHTFLYRDGGPDLTRRIVAEAAAHLTPGGTLQMLIEWPEHEGGDWGGEVAGWVEGSACDAWLMRFNSESIGAYAERWLRQEYETEIPEEALASWVAPLRARGIGSVGGGLLVLRPAAEAVARTCFRDAPPVERQGLAGSLARWLACQAFLGSLADERALLDSLLSAAPGLERRDVRSIAGEGWSPPRRELRLRSGLCFGAGVDPIAAEVVGLLDGRRTPREALALLCASLDLPPEAFLEGLPGALRRLVELGLLLPPG